MAAFQGGFTKSESSAVAASDAATLYSLQQALGSGAGNAMEDYMGDKDRADASVWHVVKEKREYKDLKRPDGTPETYEATLLRRDDGLTVERIGLGRPGELDETFLFKGSFGEFKVSASRYDMLKGITDTYVVMLYPPRIQKAEALARSMSKDIESALLHFPIHRIFNNIPVKNVVFQVTRGYSSDTVLRAGET
jgi:hypothetical protein